MERNPGSPFLKSQRNRSLCTRDPGQSRGLYLLTLVVTSPAILVDPSLSIHPLKPPAKEQPDRDQLLQVLSNVTVQNESTSCCPKRFSHPQTPACDHLELEGPLRHPSSCSLCDTDTWGSVTVNVSILRPAGIRAQVGPQPQTHHVCSVSSRHHLPSQSGVTRRRMLPPHIPWCCSQGNVPPSNVRLGQKATKL